MHRKRPTKTAWIMERQGENSSDDTRLLHAANDTPTVGNKDPTQGTDTNPEQLTAVTPRLPSLQNILSPPLSSLPLTTDVVILGAGPAGLVLACELARRHFDFIVFDAMPRSAAHTPSIVLSARTLEILADLGLAEAVVLEGKIVRGAQISMNNRPPFDVGFWNISSPFPFSLVLSQARLEEILIEHLAQLGHVVFRPVATWKVEIEGPRDPSEYFPPIWKPERKSQHSSGTYINTTTISEHQIRPLNASSVAPPSRSDSQQELKTAIGGRAGSCEDPFPLSMEGYDLNASALATVNNAAVEDVIQASPWAGTALSEQHFGCSVQVRALHPQIYSPQPSADAPIHSPVIRCRYIVGCDGQYSTVRQAVELSFDSYGPHLEFIMVDFAVQWAASPTAERFHVLQYDRTALVLCPLGPDETPPVWRLIKMCPARPGAVDKLEKSSLETEVEDKDETPLTFSEIQNLLLLMAPAALVQEILWQTRFICNSRIAKHFGVSYALLVGEAAHMHPPFLANGVNTGIQDAFNLGWKLAAVLRGGSGILLESYETERREVAENIAKHLGCVNDLFFKGGSAVRWLIATMAPVVTGLDFVGSAVARTLLDHHVHYPLSPIVGKNLLARGAAEPGSLLGNASLLVFPLSRDNESKLSNVPRTLAHVTRGGRHTLLLFVHVLPPGTRVRTLLGCERNEEAVRWSARCLTRLARLAKLLLEAFKGREKEVAWGGIKIVWILCGLVNFRSANNTVSLGEIQHHIPHRLTYFFTHAAKIHGQSFVGVDYEGEVHTNLGLRLADPYGPYGDDKSGCFMLVRPDGFLCCNGYSGDTEAASAAFDYALTCFTD